MVHFYPDHCLIQEISTQETIDRGDKAGKLYIFHPDSIGTSHTTYVNNVYAPIWHARLGHPSFKIMEVLQHQLQLTALNLHHQSPCYVCPLAKQRRLPFFAQNHMSKSPFDLIRCDVWGPCGVSAYTGDRFFVILVDDCTHFSRVFMIKNKSDVFHVIPKFFRMVHTQFNVTIKQFRADNAPTYTVSRVVHTSR